MVDDVDWCRLPPPQLVDQRCALQQHLAPGFELLVLLENRRQALLFAPGLGQVPLDIGRALLHRPVFREPMPSVARISSRPPMTVILLDRR